MGKRLTIEQFAQRIKDINPSLANVPDEVLTRKVLERRPDLMSQVENVTPRRKSNEPQGSAVGRYLKGASEPLTGIPKFYKDALGEGLSESKKDGFFNTLIHPSKWAYSKEEMDAYDKAHPKPDSSFGSLVEGVAGVPAVTDKFNKGDTAGAGGVATTQAIMMALPFLRKGGAVTKGTSALDETTSLGKGSKIDAAALDAAKNLSQEAASLLDSQIDTLNKSMAGQFVDVKQLRADIGRAANMMKKVERAPGMQVRDISAAKDVVDRLAQRAKAGMLTWDDARQFYKEINNAKGGVKGASAVRNSLNQIGDALQERLKESATKAGKGAEYEKWLKDYADLKAWERGYAKTVKGMTPDQMEASATAKPGVKIPKTNLTLGGSNKTAKIAKTELKGAHKGLAELTKRIKSSPAGGSPPPVNPGQGQVIPPKPALPPAGSTQMPSVSQSTAGQMLGQQPPKQLGPASSIQLPPSSATPPANIAGGSGTFSRTQRANPLEFPEAGPAPLKTPPDPKIQQAIQDILSKMNTDKF